jgi:integrase
MTKHKRAVLTGKAVVLRPQVTPPALDPRVLHAQAEASARAILKAGRSKNTAKSYASALRYWAAWFRLRFDEEFTLPVAAATVVQFLTDHVLRPAAERGDDEELVSDLPPSIDAALVEGKFKDTLGPLAFSTIRHRLSVLSTVHTRHKLPSPTHEPVVRELVSAARRAYAARGVRPHRKTALTRDPLEAMVATCTDGLCGLRDAALLQVGFASGGRRVSEIVGMVMARLRYIVPADGSPAYYLYELGVSKTDQTATAEDRLKPIKGPAAVALRAWLEASGITSGRLWRRMHHERIGEKPLTAQGVRYLLARRVRLAGLEGDYSPHSIRRGFVTEAGRQGKPPGDAKALSGHRSLAVFMEYFEAGAVAKNPAADLLGK